MNTSNNNRLSYMRVTACIAIVVLHMVFGAVSIYGDTAIPVAQLVSHAIVNNLYWAVPCFLMVSGYLLLDPSRDMSFKKIFTKYVLRVGLALLIFSVLYRVFDMVMNKEGFTAGGFLKGFANFFTGNSWSHLWYLYVLIGLYLLLPFFRMITEKSTTKQLTYLLIVLLIFTSILPILGIWNISIGFNIPVATIYPLYFLFGYYVSKSDVNVSKAVPIVGLIASTAALIALTYIRYNQNKDGLETFFSYSSILVVIQACSIFMLFAKKKEKKQSIIGKFFLSFDKCSFGIYLVHMFFARTVLRYINLNPYENPGMFLGCIVGIIIVSYLIVWVLRKIPKVDKVL